MVVCASEPAGQHSKCEAGEWWSFPMSNLRHLSDEELKEMVNAIRTRLFPYYPRHYWRIHIVDSGLSSGPRTFDKTHWFSKWLTAGRPCHHLAQQPQLANPVEYSWFASGSLLSQSPVTLRTFTSDSACTGRLKSNMPSFMKGEKYKVSAMGQKWKSALSPHKTLRVVHI